MTDTLIAGPATAEVLTREVATHTRSTTSTSTSTSTRKVA